MGVLSFLDFMFSSFSFYREKRQRDWDNKYKDYPTGTQIVEKWNATPSLIYKKRKQ